MDRNGYLDLYGKINYTFNDENLLKLAFTHSSYANEYKKEKMDNNERLEFLGDAVLELIVSEYIFKKYNNMPEGELTKLRASIVCEPTLSEISQELGFGEYLILGRGEENTGGRQRESILADTFEAVIGAIFIDGGIEAAKAFILTIMEPYVEKMRLSFKTVDCKTYLQEIIQKTSKEAVEYEVVSEDGPDHDKSFVTRVTHGGKVLGTGSGKSKKEAEQNAALAALDSLT